MKTVKRYLMVLILFAMPILLFSCQSKTFYECEIHEVIGSNRDTYSRKISEDFFLTFQRSDSRTNVYWLSSPDQDKTVEYAVNSVDRVWICGGFFDEYGEDENMLYLRDSKSESIAIVDKSKRTIEIVKFSEFNSFVEITWHKR